MVSWQGLAFVSPFMLLIYNNQPQARKRRKQRRPWADHNVDLPVLRPQELIVALPFRKPGVHDGHPLPKPARKARDRLVSQGNFRNQHNRLPARLNGMGNQLHVNLRLSAARNAMQQARLLRVSAHLIQNRAYRGLLHLI